MSRIRLQTHYNKKTTLTAWNTYDADARVHVGGDTDVLKDWFVRRVVEVALVQLKYRPLQLLHLWKPEAKPQVSTSSS